jgi:hypothetical protein
MINKIIFFLLILNTFVICSAWFVTADNQQNGHRSGPIIEVIDYKKALSMFDDKKEVNLFRLEDNRKSLKFIEEENKKPTN